MHKEMILKKEVLSLQVFVFVVFSRSFPLPLWKSVVKSLMFWGKFVTFIETQHIHMLFLQILFLSLLQL